MIKERVSSLSDPVGSKKWADDLPVLEAPNSSFFQLTGNIIRLKPASTTSDPDTTIQRWADSSMPTATLPPARASLATICSGTVQITQLILVTILGKKGSAT